MRRRAAAIVLAGLAAGVTVTVISVKPRADDHACRELSLGAKHASLAAED